MTISSNLNIISWLQKWPCVSTLDVLNFCFSISASTLSNDATVVRGWFQEWIAISRRIVQMTLIWSTIYEAKLRGSIDLTIMRFCRGLLFIIFRKKSLHFSKLNQTTKRCRIFSWGKFNVASCLPRCSTLLLLLELNSHCDPNFEDENCDNKLGIFHSLAAKVVIWIFHCSTFSRKGWGRAGLISAWYQNLHTKQFAHSNVQKVPFYPLAFVVGFGWVIAIFRQNLIFVPLLRIRIFKCNLNPLPIWPWIKFEVKHLDLAPGSG